MTNLTSAELWLLLGGVMIAIVILAYFISSLASIALANIAERDANSRKRVKPALYIPPTEYGRNSGVVVLPPGLSYTPPATLTDKTLDKRTITTWCPQTGLWRLTDSDRPWIAAYDKDMASAYGKLLYYKRIIGPVNQ